MAGTQVRMQRSALTVEGTSKYQIVATCTVKGDLADTGIFLLNIITHDDPKDDTLARVIQVADVSKYSTDRDSAIDVGDAYWRANGTTLQFDDIEVANAAWKELSSRINSLIKQVDDYNEEFLTFADGEVITYPTVDTSVVDQLKAAYVTAAAAVDTATDARDEHQKECNDKQKELDVVEERLEEAQDDLDRLVQIQAQLGTSNTTLTTVYSSLFNNNASIRTLNNASTATTVEKSDIESELSENDALLIQFNSANSSLASLLSGLVAAEVSTLQARVASLISNKNKLLTDLNKCNIEVASLQGAVDAARATRDEALAAVREVCPDYVP